MNMFKFKKSSKKNGNAAKVFFVVLAIFIAVSVMQAVQLNDMLSHVRAIETEVESLSLEQQSLHTDLGLR